MIDKEWLDKIESTMSDLTNTLGEIRNYIKKSNESRNQHDIDILDSIKETQNKTLASIEKGFSNPIELSPVIKTDYLEQEIKTQRIKVKNKATPLPKNPLPGRKLLIIDNISNEKIYYGGKNVQGGTGLHIDPGAVFIVNTKPDCKWFAVVSGNSKNIIIGEGK